MRKLLTLVLTATLSLPALAALKPGAAAPAFTAPAFLAGKPFTYDLNAALKQGPVVLYFFPAAFTPGCNAEAAAFSRAIDRFKAQGATVIGVTAGNIDRLEAFSTDTEKCAGKFPVAADPGAKIAATYDATMALKSDLASRTSYLIGRDGKVVAVYDAMNPNQHVQQMLNALAAIKARRASAPPPHGH